MSTRTRRLKWHPTPPPPSPKIINLPRRHHTRRKKSRTTVNKQPTPGTGGTAIETCSYKGKLESLFGEEREFARAPVVLSNSPARRERVEQEEEEDGGGELAEEKWRFQAEILRAECNFLRMERKFALKKLERNRVRTEMVLKSALQNLSLGRKKLFEGKNMEVVVEDEMKELEQKLEELQSSFNGGEDLELRKCKNFDKKARRLKKLGGFQSNFDCTSQTKSNDVEILRMKMEGLSMGMMDRILSTTNSSVASSASTSRRIDVVDPSSKEEEGKKKKKKCSGRCKMMVRKIVEQVRLETEQWSQMQDMLAQLRQEMEDLQTSKNFWEAQALDSSNQIQFLQSSVEEWRRKAMEYEAKANEAQKEVILVKGEIENLKKDQSKEMKVVSLGLEKETKKDLPPLSLGKQLAREKRILICRLKENRQSSNSVRSPFKDIGNSSASSSIRQNSNAIFPLHCLEK